MKAKFYGFERSFLHDTTEEDAWVIDMVRASEYVKLESEVASLQERVRALAVLAEERREFIVNGAELGHIEMPVFNDDPATAIYQRCLLNSEFAAAAVLREIRAQAVESYANYSDECYGTHDKSGEDARVYAARIRSGE